MEASNDYVQFPKILIFIHRSRDTFQNSILAEIRGRLNGKLKACSFFW